MGYTVTINTDAHSSMVGFGDWMSGGNVYPITRTPPYTFTTSDPAGYAQLMIEPAVGYRFSTFVVDGVPRSLPYYNNKLQSVFFYNTQDHVVDMTTELDVYTITASAGLNGSTPYPGVTTVQPGTVWASEFTPNAGYRISSVVVDGVNVGETSSYVFTNIQASHTISVEFELAPPKLTVTRTGGGNIYIFDSGLISVYPDMRDFISGTKVFSTIVWDARYVVSDVKINGVSVSLASTYTLYYSGHDQTVDVTFIRESMVITSSSGANGSISPLGAISVFNGTNKTFTITPDAHYHIQDVLVDSVSVGPVTSYTFNNVQAVHTISVVFAMDTYAIQALAGAHGSIMPSGEIAVPYGGTQSFIITPDENYRIQDVIVDGVIREMPVSGTLFID